MAISPAVAKCSLGFLSEPKTINCLWAAHIFGACGSNWNIRCTHFVRSILKMPHICNAADADPPHTMIYWVYQISRKVILEPTYLLDAILDASHVHFNLHCWGEPQTNVQCNIYFEGDRQNK